MRAPLRVMHVITRMDRGGSAQNTYLTVMGQQPRFAVLLAYGSWETTEPEEAEAIRQDQERALAAGISLREVPSLRREVEPASDLAALIAIWRLIRQERPTIVHTHTSKAGAIGRVAAWLARVPVIVHTPHGHIFYGYYGKMASRGIALLERWLARLTDRIVVLTRRGIDEHLEVGVGRAAQFRVVHSGVQLGRFRNRAVSAEEVRKGLGLPPKGAVIMTVGRLVPIKGYMTLVEAAPQILSGHPDAAVVFVGAGPLQSSLMGRARELGVEKHLHFAGHRLDVPDCLTAADIFVLPSLNEGMGRVLVEAMAMGKASVASRVGGIPSLISDGQNGLLVPPRDPAALAKAVLRLLDDVALRSRLGRAALAIADEGYDTETMVRKIEEVYAEVLAEKHVA